MSSTNKAKDLQNSCRRKRVRECGTFLNGSGEASLSLSAADELYTDCSGSSSPPKKRKVNDSCRFQQKNDDILNRTYADDVQVSENHNSSECRTGSNIVKTADCIELAHLTDQPHVALRADEQQSANFEQLLLGLISGSECAPVVPQKCDTACVVESSGEQIHKADICSSISDTSSDSSDTDTYNNVGQVGVNNQYSLEGNAHLGGTSCLSSTCASVNYSNKSAADSELHTVNARSEYNETDLSQSTKKQNKEKKPEKWTLDCAKLCSKSECQERKSKQKRRHMLASVPPSQTFSNNNSQFALLRKVRRMMNMHEVVCGKMSLQTTMGVVDHCSELSDGSIENMSSSEPGCRRVPESNKKHRRQELTEDYTEFERSQLIHHKKKRHHDDTSSAVNSLCSNVDNLSLPSNKEHRTIEGEEVVFEINSVQAVDHLDSSVQNTGRELDRNDGCCTVSAFSNKPNAFTKKVTLTGDSVGFKNSQPLSHKKKKKKRYREHNRVSTHTAELERIDKFSSPCTLPLYNNDCLELNVSHTECAPSDDDGYVDLSGKQQNNSEKSEKITEVENHCSVNNEGCVKSIESDSTPNRTKPKPKMLNDCSSPLIYADSNSPAACLSVMSGSVDRQTAAVLFHDSSACSVKNSGDVLLEKDLPQKCGAVLCENMSIHKKSEEDEFEQLLLNVLVADKSCLLSHSLHESSKTEDFAVSNKAPGHERSFSESTSDDDEQQRILETASPVSEGADRGDNCSENPETVKDTVTEVHVVSDDSATDNIQSQSVHCEDESQTYNFRHRQRKDGNVTSANCCSDVDSSASSTSGVDTELGCEPTHRAQCQVFLATDVVDPPAGLDLSPPLSPNYSVCDAVEESQFEQHAAPEDSATCTASQINSTGIQLPHAEDCEHQQQVGQKDLLIESSEGSVCSGMSDEDCVSVTEQSEPVTELGSKSVMSHPPSSPLLFSSDEEDRVCSGLSQAEEESAVENEAVSSLIMWNMIKLIKL